MFDREDMHRPPQYGSEEAHDPTCWMPTTKHQDRDHERLPSRLQTDREEKTNQQPHLAPGGPRGQQGALGGPQSQVFFNTQKSPNLRGFGHFDH